MLKQGVIKEVDHKTEHTGWKATIRTERKRTARFR